jgi:hypothetical protein
VLYLFGTRVRVSHNTDFDISLPLAERRLYPDPGWNSPAGSVVSDQPPRGGPPHSPKWVPSRPPLCFLCNVHGHFLAECPRLPVTLQREAAENRAAYELNRDS